MGVKHLYLRALSVLLLPHLLSGFHASNSWFGLESHHRVCHSHNVVEDDYVYPVNTVRCGDSLPLLITKFAKLALLSSAVVAGGQSATISAASARWDDTLTIPLTKYDGVFCMNYTVNGNLYRGIVDTGSPFLIVPSVNTRIWGYTKPDSVPYIDSGLSKTTEIFGGQDYETFWKVGDLELSGSYRQKSVVFANVGEDIMRPPGGVFVGLIKYKAEDIRPTLMGQMQFSSIKFDAYNKILTLSKYSLIKAPVEKLTTIPMVDLRLLGDPVYHYAAKVKSLLINGREIASNSTIYAVFDTGTTGCVLSDDLMNDYETPNPIRNVRIVLTGEQGNDVVIESGATRDEIFVVTAAKIPWFTKESAALKNYFDDTTLEVPQKIVSTDTNGIIGQTAVVESDIDDDSIISANIARRLLSEPQVVVIGLTFFKSKVLTIDIEDGRLSLTNAIPRLENS